MIGLSSMAGFFRKWRKTCAVLYCDRDINLRPCRCLAGFMHIILFFINDQ